jgi:hypothetical protein
MMLKAVLSPPNAILFVFDPTNGDVVIPPYVDGELTAATETCVSVGTQADVDGETEVSLAMAAVAQPDLQRVFAGAVATPGGKVAVVTSEFNRVLELDVPKGGIEVVIWTDDLRNPARVVVNVKPSAVS